MSGASEAHPSPAASVCPTARISTIVELRSNARLARREDEINQTLRLGLTLLNHQTRIAPATTTNKIVSFICALRKNHLLLSEASSQAPFVPLLFSMQPPIALGCSALPWPLQRLCQQPRNHHALSNGSRWNRQCDQALALLRTYRSDKEGAWATVYSVVVERISCISAPLPFGKTPEHPSPHRSFFHRIFWLCQSRVSMDPINRILLGSKFPKMVHGPIRPNYLHAPNLAVFHWR